MTLKVNTATATVAYRL